MENMDPTLRETNRTVQDMPGIKTGLGRARAFLRLSLMSKKLPDYLDALQSADQARLSAFYKLLIEVANSIELALKPNRLIALNIGKNGV